MIDQHRFCESMLSTLVLTTEASKSAYISAFPEVKEKAKAAADQVSGLATAHRRST